MENNTNISETKKPELSYFISYCSENSWALPGLLTLLMTVNHDALRFCSFEGCINPGEKYSEAIFRSLKKADIFIPILSNEYWKSKYCIIELGAAYERYCFDQNRSLKIIPLILPPLKKDMAFANTPLTELEVKDITKLKDLLSVLYQFVSEDHKDYADPIEPMAADYVSFVKHSVLSMQSLYEKMETGAYFQEIPQLPCDRHDVVRRITNEDGSIRFLFDFPAAGYDPEFASLAFIYYDTLNLRKYLKFDRDSALCFNIENKNHVLNAITVELKYTEAGGDHFDIPFALQDGMNTLAIPLRDYDAKRLKKISQICFVIHPKEKDTMNSRTGEIVISGLHVNFSRRNILEEVKNED